MTHSDAALLHLALPKGRMQEGVLALLREAGIQVHVGSRNYRPSISLDHVETKMLKPQNIVEMLHVGSRDIGFAGADWVAEKGAQIEELVDLQLDPVSVVAAAPTELLESGALPGRKLVVASEYETLTRQWIAARGFDDTFVRTYGATEVFPPEDADCIVDNTATGSTLKANGLHIVDTVMRSSTRFYASRKAMDTPAKRDAIEDLILVIQSVLAARARVMVELNVTSENLQAIVDIMPCMREPTISPLHSSKGYALKAAVLRETLAGLIPQVKAAGGTDIVVTGISQIVL